MLKCILHMPYLPALLLAAHSLCSFNAASFHAFDSTVLNHTGLYLQLDSCQQLTHTHVTMHRVNAQSQGCNHSHDEWSNLTTIKGQHFNIP